MSERPNSVATTQVGMWKQQVRRITMGAAEPQHEHPRALRSDMIQYSFVLIIASPVVSPRCSEKILHDVTCHYAYIMLH